RAQEIMIVLEEFISKKIIPKVPIYLEGMISEATAIHTTHPEYLNAELREKIFHQGNNPFLSDVFKVVTNGDEERQEIANGDPAIIMATSGMLQGGPSISYLRKLAEDEKSVLLFVSYQVEGTLGRKIQKGYRDLKFENKQGMTTLIKLKMKIYTISGFSGHSSRSQIVNYIRKLNPKPDLILTDHGEASKCTSLASLLHKRLKIETRSLSNMEAIILK
ncbi:MAG: MBL fold metallo-hydrolase RNA specificity domain-containing protein, partial [Promethearchaeota archaeon]